MTVVDPSLLPQRTAVVTGAASGIGAACVRRFLADGYQVVGVDLRSVEDVQDPGFTSLVCDLTNHESVDDLREEIGGRLGHVTVLVNSAGIFELGDIESTDPAAWERALAVNLTSVYRLCRALAPYLVDGEASIVNLSSVAGLVTFPDNLAYSSTKFGVIGLTKSLALDLGKRGIRVNAVCPFSIDGPMMDRYFETFDDPAAQRRALESGVPLQRMGTVEEVANAISFLAGPEASFISGVALPIDGGYVVQ